MTWAADNATVYYTTVDDAWRPDTVWRHRLGSTDSDESVYHEPDERYWVAVGRTRSNAYVIIAAGSAVTSEIRYADAADPAATFTTVLPAATASNTPSNTPSSAARTVSRSCTTTER